MRISAQLIDVIRTHLGLSRRQARNRAIHLLERVGIPDAPGRIDAHPHEFLAGHGGDLTASLTAQSHHLTLPAQSTFPTDP